MKCPKCNGDIEMMVDVTLIIPGEMNGNITKISLRSKDIKLYAANWPKASYFCKDKTCRWRDVPMLSKRKGELI